MTTQEVALGNIPLMLVFLLCRLDFLLCILRLWIVLSLTVFVMLVFHVCEQNC